MANISAVLESGLSLAIAFLLASMSAVLAHAQGSCFERTLLMTRYHYLNPNDIRQNYQDIYKITFASAGAQVTRLTKGAISSPPWASLISAKGRICRSVSWTVWATIFVTVLVFSGAHCSRAVAAGNHPADDIIGNPPDAELAPAGKKGPTAGSESLVAGGQTVELDAADGVVAWDADIAYTNGQIFNPQTGQFDKVRLRSYQGPGVSEKTPFVAPTINLAPGETFRLTLDNRLPADDPSCPGTGDPNKPHCFNATNMHTHGLWISPVGNSDNVLIRINPGVSFTYEYNIPEDHPAGTFWYHPHLHGSTALQVSSGMAGVLVVRGKRLPRENEPGDIDTLLRNADGSAFPEKILLFQQIQYACRDEAGNIKVESGSPNGRWICEPGDVGTVEGYDQFGPGSWPSSGRYTSINGHVVPTFESVAGQIERWRLIHAGVRDTIKPSFRKLSAPSVEVASAAAFSAATTDAQAAFVDANCSGATVSQLSMAADGLTRNRLVPQSEGVLQPGYREDLLVVFPEAGTYCIVDGEARADETVDQHSKSRKLLGYIKVVPGSGLGGLDQTEYIKQRLIDSAQRFMPEVVRTSIVDDLQQRLGLRAFAPHAPIADNEVTDKQSLAFNIDFSGEDLAFQIGELTNTGGLKDPQPYDPKRMDRELALGGVDEWSLKSFLGGQPRPVGHPFHIHVNPFQIVEVLDRDGRDVSGFEPGKTSQYAGLKGVWKDTLFVEGDGHTVVLRTRYKRYIGDFVLHCHILDHEDQGMMQNIRISLPDGKGGFAAAHH